MQELSDEEYGRRWAAMMGKRPWSQRDDGDPDVKQYWAWYVGHRAPWDLPWCIQVTMRSDDVSGSESGAYAALGRAVRSIHAAVPMLPEQRAGG